MPTSRRLRQAFLYADTLVRLRRVQWTNRLRRFLLPARVPDGRPAPPRASCVAPLISGVLNRPSWDGSRTFSFLNRTEVVSWPDGWNDPALPLLWLYNLHYFADLHARGAAERHDAHRELLDRWIADNPPAGGIGWDPYPVSLRIRNWVRWWFESESPRPQWVASLATQARWLERNLEYHLLGNHLLENAFALFAAGCWFGGCEGRAMRVRGARLISEQLQEQVLADGGHFERSPMYHALMLQGLLDSVNLGQATGFAVPLAWLTAARRMCEWLVTVVHPDGEIPLLNDSAFGVAALPGDLVAYAERVLGQRFESSRASAVLLRDSGYVVVRRRPWHGILDVGALGPRFLAAHGHADTLCCELSIRGRRFLVDPGTSTYVYGPQRSYERSTPAHNTVAVDGRDSSNVWHAFRTGRQAIVTLEYINERVDFLEVAANHDGYARMSGMPVHSRTWRLEGDRLVIRDKVTGKGRHRLSVRFTLAPGWSVSEDPSAGAMHAEHADGWHIRITSRGVPSLRTVPGQYHPEFGVSEAVAAFDAVGEVELPTVWEMSFAIAAGPGCI